VTTVKEVKILRALYGEEGGVEMRCGLLELTYFRDGGGGGGKRGGTSASEAAEPAGFFWED